MQPETIYKRPTEYSEMFKLKLSRGKLSEGALCFLKFKQITKIPSKTGTTIFKTKKDQYKMVSIRNV
jgi:hypothetical protein